MNVSHENIDFLKEFIKTKPFVVLECNKNIGSAIISHSLLDSLANEHLNGNNTYLLLNSDPTIQTVNYIINKLKFSKCKLHLHL